MHGFFGCRLRKIYDPATLVYTPAFTIYTKYTLDKVKHEPRGIKHDGGAIAVFIKAV